MILEKVKRDYSYSILMFLWLEFIFVLSAFLLSLLFADIITEALIILGIGTIGLWYITISRIRLSYRRAIKHSRFRIKTLDHRLNYPSYFVKGWRIPLFIWGKAYISNGRIIPKAFVSFVEGKLAYPIKEITEINAHLHVDILYIYKGYAALIQDANKKKYLIHLSNLEPIE